MNLSDLSRLVRRLPRWAGGRAGPAARFRADRSGNVAVLFTLGVIPLLAVAGSALDYARATSARAQAQAAVDAAALAAVQKLARSRSEAELTAAQVFTQSAPEALRAVPASVTVSADGQSIRVCAYGQMGTMLARFAGQANLALETCSEAVRPSRQYIDVFLGLDVSASMGLAADEAGRDRLRALTGCAFACHEREGGQAKSNYEVARENAIPTRVDVLRQATRSLNRSLLSPADPSNGAHRNEFRMAMFSISDSADKLLAPPTANASRVDNEVERIHLAMNTQFDVALPLIDREIGTQGSGSDRNDPRKVFFLVTDGVQSKRFYPWGSSAFRPIDVSLCESIKRRGIPVAVLNVRYVPMPDEAPYRGTVGRFQDQLNPNLRACASEGMYFEAERPDEIVQAFEKFSGTLTQYRLAR